MNEFFNRAIRFINRNIHKVYFFIVTVVEISYMRLIGVHVGKYSKFNGWCSVYRQSNSQIEIGDNCTFNSTSFSNHIGVNRANVISTMNTNASVIIGDNVGISGTTITAFNQISIGDNVRIGANCTIMDGDFHLDDSRTSSPQPIYIMKNVWLGANVVVLKGVTIGENTIIGMNSVVTKDIPDNVVAAGSPCRVIKPIANKEI